MLRALAAITLLTSLLTACGSEPTSQVQNNWFAASAPIGVKLSGSSAESPDLLFGAPSNADELFVCVGQTTCSANDAKAIRAEALRTSNTNRRFYRLRASQISLRTGMQIAITAPQGFSSTTTVVRVTAKGIQPNNGQGNPPTVNSSPQTQNTGELASSGGSGGQTGNYSDSTAGVKFKVWAPSAAQQKDGPTQVFMYLHGDTAGDYHGDSFARTRDHVLSKGLIFAAVLAPDGNSWWRSNESSVVSGVNGVFEYLMQKYDIYRNQNIVQGVSGGSTGQTMYYYPGGGSKYVKASFLHCGGAPGGSLRSWNPTAEERSRMKFFINYGENDYLADPNGTYGNVIGGTVDALKGKNLDVTVNVIPGAGHCRFDHFPYVERELDQLIVR